MSRLPVCPECLGRLHPIVGRVCSICGDRVLSAYAHCDEDGLCRCPTCRRVDHTYYRAAAYGSYDGELRELIHMLKYNAVRPAATVLGRALAEVLSSLAPSVESAVIPVIPVPLHKSKRRQRGFNQAELIACEALKVCSAGGRFRLRQDMLLRVRDTHSQIGLTSHQRRENLRGEFAVERADELNGQEVVLVDDVYTTGTTASECARVLRRAGASRVWVVTVARTLKTASKYEEVEGLHEQGLDVSGLRGFPTQAELQETVGG